MLTDQSQVFRDGVLARLKPMLAEGAVDRLSHNGWFKGPPPTFLEGIVTVLEKNPGFTRPDYVPPEGDTPLAMFLRALPITDAARAELHQSKMMDWTPLGLGLLARTAAEHVTRSSNRAMLSAPPPRPASETRLEGILRAHFTELGSQAREHLATSLARSFPANESDAATVRRIATALSSGLGAKAAGLEKPLGPDDSRLTARPDQLGSEAPERASLHGSKSAF